MTETDLFEPIEVGRYRLKNRMVMAAMTRNRSPNETPGDLNVEYYGQRATAGLIVAESTAISEQGLGWRDSPGIYNAAQIAGWRRVTDAIHRVGGHTSYSFGIVAAARTPIGVSTNRHRWHPRPFARLAA